MKILFHDKAFLEYLSWQNTDKKTLKRINELIKDIMRNPYEGIGKPEPLRYQLTGYWSRRINKEDRLIYKIEGDLLIIISCSEHYKKNR
ncbi:MAG: Txe/YoeB family addiction module toxin [Peptoniphilus grossensis]|uniref:Txe/YoeB family addiction module toxin n=1 Tax=Peptoniphilus grossensis TaxID=1465756 RepID=UPI002912A951|nr:Txe/YoeB family addiction module toxin [Peptoniphilus grossensis]MDU7150764.1 Txe/YoeB family addiction module toxin [Peptoniphilus grossensis]